MRFLAARLRSAIPAWALAYAALWITALLSLHLDGPLQALTGCRIDPEAPLPLWSCGESGGSMMTGALVNAALLTVIWAPALMAAAFVRPDAVPLAIVAFGSHLVGLASIMAMVARGIRFMMRRWQPT